MAFGFRHPNRARKRVQPGTLNFAWTLSTLEQQTVSSVGDVFNNLLDLIANETGSSYFHIHSFAYIQ
jgi:hypothetical protein